MAAEYLHFAPHATRSPPQDPHAAPQCQLEARHSPAGGHQGAKTQFEAQEAAYERAGAGGRAFGPQETSASMAAKNVRAWPGIEQARVV